MSKHSRKEFIIDATEATDKPNHGKFMHPMAINDIMIHRKNRR
jgi:hypothetical protein